MEKVNEFHQKALQERALKNTAESVKYLKKALGRLAEFMKAEPANQTYPLRRAAIYSSINAHKYAENDLLLAIRCDKRNAAPLFLLGNVYLQTKDFEMANQAYDKFFVLDKRQSSGQDHAEVYFNRAIARNGLEWYEEALGDLDEVEALNPQYPKMKESRSTIESNKLDNKISEYSGILGFKPRDWGTLFKRAALFQKIGNIPSMIKDYEAILKIQPRNMEAMVKLGLAYYDDGQYQLAVEILDQARLMDIFYEREQVAEYTELAKKALGKL